MANDEQAKYIQIRADIRSFTRDTPELNRLLKDYESTDDQLDLAIRRAIDHYNTTPPIFKAVTILTYPSLDMLLYGCALRLLESAGLKQSRNELNYSSGGVQVRVSDKTGLYQSWIARFEQKYYRQLLSYKKAININSGWGGVHSEYDDLYTEYEF